MIKMAFGDLFESGAQVLVNPVNCIGAMGAGVALQFKRRYPGMFREYKHECDYGHARVGLLMQWTAPNGQLIVNLPTKVSWRFPSEYRYVEKGLIALATLLEEPRFEGASVALPPLGCGLGGLDWDVVLPMILKHLGPSKAMVLVYAPQYKEVAS